MTLVDPEFVPVCGKLLFVILLGCDCIAAIGWSCSTRVLSRSGHRTTRCVGVDNMALISEIAVNMEEVQDCGVPSVPIRCAWSARFGPTCILIPMDGSFAKSR